MQVASVYWQRITEALLHVHEKRLQIERGQQVELHLLWHRQQSLLLEFHDRKVSSYAGRERKNPHTSLLCLHNADICFLFEKNISVLIQVFLIENTDLHKALLFNVCFGFGISNHVKNADKTQLQLYFPLPLKLCNLYQIETGYFSPITCSNQGSS